MLMVLSWSSDRRPNSSAIRWLSSSFLPGLMLLDSLEALSGRRCLLSREWGGGGRRGAWVGGGGGLVTYICC